MYVSSNTTNVQPSHDSLGKITWVDEIFCPRVKPQMPLYLPDKLFIYDTLFLKQFIYGHLNLCKLLIEPYCNLDMVTCCFHPATQLSTHSSNKIIYSTRIYWFWSIQFLGNLSFSLYCHTPSDILLMILGRLAQRLFSTRQ